MSRKLNNILITGGAGFIGSNFIHYLFGLSSAEGNLFDDAKKGIPIIRTFDAKSKCCCFNRKNY